MDDSYKKIARILRIDPANLEELDKKMSGITGQKGVIADIVMENKLMVDRTLSELGLNRNSSAEDVYDALMKNLIVFDKHLFDYIGKPDLMNMPDHCGKLCETTVKLFPPPKGLFLKKEKVIQMLEKHKPDNLLNHFGYKSVSELMEKEGFASVVSSLRFAQDTKWMHSFFDSAYSDITKDDFEERDVEMIVLHPKWLEVAEKYLKKKYHNISHLKEFGIIFVVPIPLNNPGETMRMFMLMIHYLHEVSFYTSLFRRYMDQPDFNDKFKSLLRGDVPSGGIIDGGKVVWRIIQRYIAKDNENDQRLFESHVNPEAEHWYRAEQDLSRLSRILSSEGAHMSISYWTGLDFVGDFFTDKNGEEVLVSFDLIDLIMSLVERSRIKYLYHHEEALWNKLFAEYMGRETMNRLVEENIIDGFIVL